jgi:hypothetical protein
MTIERESVNFEPEDSGSVTWFVDEAGDPTLFGKGGKVVAATEGCSRFFIAGKLECRDVVFGAERPCGFAGGRLLPVGFAAVL